MDEIVAPAMFVMLATQPDRGSFIKSTKLLGRGMKFMALNILLKQKEKFNQTADGVSKTGFDFRVLERKTNA